MYRKTYVKVNKENITDNIKTIINAYPFYQYYFGVVKANCYSHGDVINAIIKGGCNYLAVATLEEALKIRKNYKNIPILILEAIDIEDITIAKQNNITITVNSLEYALQIKDSKDLRIHVKLNTGMNRLGIKTKEEFDKVHSLLPIEGVYSHIYHASNKIASEKQIAYFKKMIDNKNIPIVHLQASEALENYQKLPFVNGTRLGISMYGFSNHLKLKSTFSLYSKVLQIQTIEKGEKVGYDGKYVAKEKEKIAIVAIGYADGIIRKNTGRNVYIHNKPYQIVGNICMDMLFVKVDETVQVNDEVIILKDIDHIKEVANHLDTIVYEVLCSITNRVPRI